MYCITVIVPHGAAGTDAGAELHETHLPALRESLAHEQSVAPDLMTAEIGGTDVLDGTDRYASITSLYFSSEEKARAATKVVAAHGSDAGNRTVMLARVLDVDCSTYEVNEPTTVDGNPSWQATVKVIYPGDSASFDLPHYLATHVPMGLESLRRETATVADRNLLLVDMETIEGADRAFACIGTLYFTSRNGPKAMEQLFADDAARTRLQEDFVNYTSQAPHVARFDIPHIRADSRPIAS